MGLFKKIGNALKKTRESFAKKFESIFSGGELNDDFYEELTDILISCDVGFEVSEEIVEELRTYARKNKIRKAEEVKQALKEISANILSESELIRAVREKAAKIQEQVKESCEEMKNKAAEELNCGKPYAVAFR